MSAETTETAPVERLADEQYPQHYAGGLTTEQVNALVAELDPARVRKKPGSGYDYLAEHDVIRTANRIFGFGRWGVTVQWHELIGQHQVKNKDGAEGWQVGYRCCVRLTVAGCLPVDGVGYGDAFEKQWSGVVTAHELALKEAESDAIKRAFKKWGDQFGLILYAKEDEKRRIAAEREAEEAARIAADPELAAQHEAQRLEQARSELIARWSAEDAPSKPATDEQVQAVVDLAVKVGGEAPAALDAALDAHREKNHGLVNDVWLGRLSAALAKKLPAGTDWAGMVPKDVGPAAPEPPAPGTISEQVIRESFALAGDGPAGPEAAQEGVSGA